MDSTQDTRIAECRCAESGEASHKRLRTNESLSVKLMEHWIDRINEVEAKVDMLARRPFLSAMSAGGEFFGDFLGLPLRIRVNDRPFHISKQWNLFVWIESCRISGEVMPLPAEYHTPESTSLAEKYCNEVCQRRSKVARSLFPNIVDVGHEGSVLFKSGTDVEGALRTLPSIWKLFGIKASNEIELGVGRVQENFMPDFGEIPCGWHPNCPHFGAYDPFSDGLGALFSFYKDMRGMSWVLF